MTEIRCVPETLSATVVRNILAKVRPIARNDVGFGSFDFRHGRFDITASYDPVRCIRLVVRLHHRNSCDIWLIRPGDYSLLPAEAFDL